MTYSTVKLDNNNKVPLSLLDTEALASNSNIKQGFAPAVTFTGGDPTGVADSTTALQTAINKAVELGYELVLPGIYKISSGLTVNSNQFRISGIGVERSGLRPTSASFDALTIGQTSLSSLGPQGWAKDFSIIGPSSSPTTGKAALKISAVCLFKIENLKIEKHDIGVDMVNNCMGAVVSNCRIGFGGTVNVAVNLRNGDDSGSDITLSENWLSGKIAAIHASGGGGGYHVHGGQLCAGQETSSANDLAGAIVAGKDYLTGATGETSIDLYGVSFEGTDNSWCIRGFNNVELRTINCSFNPTNAQALCLGVYKNMAIRGSTAVMIGSILSGLFAGPRLIESDLSYGTWLTEIGTTSAASPPLVAGQSTFINSMAEQSKMGSKANIISNEYLSISGTKFSKNGKLSIDGGQSTTIASGVSTPATPAGTNLIKNPGFENGTVNWSINNDTNVARTTAWAKFGTYSADLFLSSAGNIQFGTRGGTSAYTAVQPNTIYTGSAYVYCPVASTVRNIYAGIDWYKADGSYIRTDPTETTPLISGDSVRKIAGPFVSPADAAFAGIIFGIDSVNANEHYYVDAVQLEIGGVTPFIAGNLGDGYAWTGTAGNSTSTRRGEYLWVVDKAMTIPSIRFPDGTTMSTVPQVNPVTDNGTVPVNTQTGTAYILALSDAGKVIEMNNSSANTITIPTNASVAFPVNTVIEIDMIGVGVTSIVAASGVTLRAPNGTKINGQYQAAVLRQRATDEWILGGSLTV